MFLFSPADSSKLSFFKKKHPGPPSTSLDPDQDRHFIGLHLGSNCLQKAIGKTYPVSMLYNIAKPNKAYHKCHHLLNPLSRLKLPTFIKWTSPFSSSGLLGVVFHSFSNNRTSCKQTVENLIRHCSLWRLILACAICLCPTKRTLVLKGLNSVLKGLNTFVVNVITSVVLFLHRTG